MPWIWVPSAVTSPVMELIMLDKLENRVWKALATAWMAEEVASTILVISGVYGASALTILTIAFEITDTNGVNAETIFDTAPPTASATVAMAVPRAVMTGPKAGRMVAIAVPTAVISGDSEAKAAAMGCMAGATVTMALARAVRAPFTKVRMTSVFARMTSMTCPKTPTSPLRNGMMIPLMALMAPRAATKVPTVPARANTPVGFSLLRAVEMPERPVVALFAPTLPSIPVALLRLR